MSNSRCQVCNSDLRCSEVDFQSPRFGNLTCLCEDCRIGYELNRDDESAKSRGGRRKGAGRPKSEPTKMQRVPVGCFGATSAVCMRYRQYNPELLERLKETAQRVDERYFDSKCLHLIMAIALLSDSSVAVNPKKLRLICQTMLNPEGI